MKRLKETIEVIEVLFWCLLVITGLRGAYIKLKNKYGK